jgi:periplasmic protein TonB
MSALTTMDAPGRRPSGLVLAFLVALGLHALVLVAVMFYRLAPPAPPGEQQVTVDLSPVMADVATQTPTEQRMSESAPPETKPIEDPKEEDAKPPPPAETAEVKPDEVRTVTPPAQAAVEPPPDAQPVEPQNQIVTSTAEQAEPLAPPPPVAAKAEEPPPAEPVKPQPDLAKLKAEREAKLRKIREEQRRKEEREERLEEIREAKAKAAREARARAAQARQGAEREAAAALRRNESGRAAAGSDPSALRRWTGAISAAIHGRMNPGAASGTGGGTALVRFTVMRSGAVTSAGLARSSGVGQIDSAALSAVRGSLPAAPPGVTQPSLSVTIPLNYRVR